MHIALIMDGNGRWAERRGLPRAAGHRAGVEALRALTEAAPSLGARVLTVYAFSSDNWKRPPSEVAALMGLLKHYLETEVSRLVERDVRLALIGRRDRLPPALVRPIERAEAATKGAHGLKLRIAFDYSARDQIATAAAAARGAGLPSRDTISRYLCDQGAVEGDVDLLIRTGGEKRLSDFMLWESAYAELYFTDRLWPDFCPEHLALAIAEYRLRDRRFGGLATSSR